MTFLPDEAISGKNSVNLAPMIDFLFLMLVFFATLAVSRVTTRDTEIDLVSIQPEVSAAINHGEDETMTVTVNVTADGTYEWVTELRDYTMQEATEISEELRRQHEKGILPEDPDNTFVMLKIDREAQWEPILKLIFAVREAGFEVHPVYLPEDEVAL